MSLVETIASLDHMRPLPVASFTPPQLPDLSAATALAEIAGASAQPVIEEANGIGDSNHRIAELVGSAQQVTESTTGRLIDIASSLINQAGPVAAGAIGAGPAAWPGAQAHLDHLARQHLARAEALVTELSASLHEISGQLVAVAQDQPSASVAGTTAPAATAAAGTGAATAAGTGELEASGHRAGDGTPQLQQAALSEETGEFLLTGDSSDGSDLDPEAGQAAVAAARSQVGTPYVWGGTTPGAGFDCSGFTQWAWGTAGVDLPRLAEEQTVGRQISAGDLREGDLVVWDGHVAMYAGNGEIIEAGDPVGVSPLRTNNLGMEFKGFWRPTG